MLAPGHHRCHLDQSIFAATMTSSVSAERKSHMIYSGGARVANFRERAIGVGAKFWEFESGRSRPRDTYTTHACMRHVSLTSITFASTPIQLASVWAAVLRHRYGVEKSFTNRLAFARAANGRWSGISTRMWRLLPGELRGCACFGIKSYFDFLLGSV